MYLYHFHVDIVIESNIYVESPWNRSNPEHSRYKFCLTRLIGLKYNSRLRITQRNYIITDDVSWFLNLPNGTNTINFLI